jgi:hypothetical protein
MAKLDEKIAQRQQWRRLAENSANPQKNIFVRVKMLDQYIRNNPSSPYIREARDLRSRLENEMQGALAQQRNASAAQQRLSEEKQTNEIRQQENARKAQMAARIIGTLKKTGGRFVPAGNGTVRDTRSGLTWTLLNSQLDLGRCLDYRSAEAYVGGLQTGGYRDWRLPTAGELAGIYKNPPFYPAAEASWYWSSESYVKGYHRIASIVTTRQETVYNIKQERQDGCGAVHAVRP